MAVNEITSIAYREMWGKPWWSTTSHIAIFSLLFIYVCILFK